MRDPVACEEAGQRPDAKMRATPVKCLLNLFKRDVGRFLHQSADEGRMGLDPP